MTNFSALDPASTTDSYDYEVLLGRLKNELSKFGLTSNQAKVYLFLEKYGPSTATHVSKTLQVPRTETYHLLTSLQNKGIVSAMFQHPTKFSALPLDKAIWLLINAEKERLKTLEGQQKELVAIWNAIPNFKVEQNETKEDKFQMLQGLNLLTGKINEMITTAKTELDILGSEKDFIKFHNAGFLDLIKNLKIESKIITSASNKSDAIFGEKLKAMVKRMQYKVKEDLCFIIKDDQELLLFIRGLGQSSRDIMAMWTDSTSMIYTMKLLFSYAWSSSMYVE